MQYGMPMSTPWGSPLSTFQSKSDFYASFPDLGANWDWESHPGSAPLSADIRHFDEWLTVFCSPTDNYGNELGIVVAFERATGKIHVMTDPLDFASAEARFGRMP